MSGIWDYDCPQFVDFAQVVQADDTNSGAFFENCELDTPEVSEGHDSVNLNRVQNYECSVRYRSTSVATTQTSHLNSTASNAVVSSTNNVELKHKQTQRLGLQSHPSTSSSSSYQDRRLAKARRISQKPSNVKKAVEKPAKKVVLVVENKPLAKGLKRTSSFGNPRPLKKKITCPTTPNCLRRSQVKNKTLKTSEQIELERIAVLRKQMGDHLKSNKAAMKKIIRPSALKPLPAPAPVKTTARKTYPLRKAIPEKGKAVFSGFAVNTAKGIENRGFSFKPPLSLTGKPDASSITVETSVVQSPGLHRCSTPFSAKRKFANQMLNKKEAAAAIRKNVKTQVPPKNKKVLPTQNKSTRSKPDVLLSQKSKNASSTLHAPVSKSSANPLLKKFHEKNVEEFQVPKPLVPKMTIGYAGIPFITKQRACSNSGAEANSSNMSNKNLDLSKPTPGKNLINVDDSKNMAPPSLGKRPRERSKLASEGVKKHCVGSTPVSSKTMPMKENENSIDRKADKKAMAWRKKVEEEIQQQTKLLLKNPRNTLLRSTKKGKNPLADITSKQNSRTNLQRSLTDSKITAKKGHKLNISTPKI